MFSELTKQVEDGQSRKDLEDSIALLGSRQQRNQSELENCLKTHDMLVTKFETNDKIRSLESNISDSQNKVLRLEHTMTKLDKQIADAKEAKASGLAKIEKCKTDHAMNVKKIDKARLLEKEFQLDLDKRQEDIRVV